MIQYFTSINQKLTKIPEPTAGCWINIKPPIGQEELDLITKEHELPPDFLTDALDSEERARYEREDGAKLILFSVAIENNTDREDEPLFVTEPIGIILTEDDYIITISNNENPILELFFNGKVKIDISDRKLFVLKILEHNVYRFLTSLRRLNGRRNLIEKELYNSSRNRELKLLLSIEKSLVYFVDALNANELLKRKLNRTDQLGIRGQDEKEDLFEDIIIDASQALAMANLYTDILNGTMETYSSIISNNLNLVIHRLTIITFLLMVPTLIASFYGMNVPNGLENNHYAFGGIILTSIIISIILAFLFKRNKMI